MALEDPPTPASSSLLLAHAPIPKAAIPAPAKRGRFQARKVVCMEEDLVRKEARTLE